MYIHIQCIYMFFSSLLIYAGFRRSDADRAQERAWLPGDGSRGDQGGGEGGTRLR